MTDTKELRERAEAATPGPWHAPGMGEIHRENHDSIAQICFNQNPDDEDDDGCGTETDAIFIAAANPSTIIELCDALDAAKAEIERLQGMIDATLDRKPDPDDPQEWERVDGAIAFHLIERHADNWTDVGRMMDAWGKARSAVLSTKGAEG